MYGYIYKTTNLLNGKIYIGQHKAKAYDLSYYGSGKILKLAIEKYGIDNFSNKILCECSSKNDLDKMEKYFINKYDSRNPLVGYNISFGGDGGDTFTGLSEKEKQERISKLKINGHFSKLTTEQNREMHIKGWNTRRKNGTDKVSESSRMKMSESHRGIKPTNEQIKKMLKTKGEISSFRGNKTKNKRFKFRKKEKFNR